MSRHFEEARRVPGHPDYFVTESGRVARIGKATLKQHLGKRGYLTVSLWRNNRGRTVPVHRVVASAFLGPRPPECTDVAHRDGNRLNNHRANLRWSTRAQNERDKVDHGRSNRGERHGMAVLTADQVRRIREDAANHIPQKEIATRLGMRTSHVSRIVTRKLWKHIA
jgi:hypothetical protein